MKPALSTVACPDWTLPEVAQTARRVGALGVELRSFGDDCRTLACEPCHTDGRKIRALFDDVGVEPMCVATSIRYDAAVIPPVIGRVIGDFEKPVKETKRAVEVASGFGCPFVRVFAFELPRSELRRPGLNRIMERLQLALTTARHTGVRLVIENGGSFPLASDLAEIIDRAASPLLAASYNAAVGAAGGDDPVKAAKMLGDRLEIVKLTDSVDGVPVALGEGELGVDRVVRGLAEQGFGGWLVHEYPKLWIRDLPEAEAVLEKSMENLFHWAGAAVTC